MNSMIRSARILLLLPFFVPLILQGQEIGLNGSFPYTTDPLDTLTSPYLPSIPSEPAGSHGLVRNDGKGNLTFADGTPVRFVGVSIAGTAAFPDSLGAIAEARRLRKLGINLVRFAYMDYSYDWAAAASILNPADGFRSLNPEQARRFDWYVYQLKQNGIYSALTLLAARAPRAEDGLAPVLLDSVPWLGQGLQFLYPQTRSAHKVVARALLDHVNPFTRTAYRDEPAIAFMELLHRRAFNTFDLLGFYTFNPAAPNLAWKQTSRVDTLYNTWLTKKYGTNNALVNAWGAYPPVGNFPNQIKEGSFEGAFDAEWVIQAGNGVAVTPILSQDSVPDGKYALNLRIRNGRGTVGDAYMYQPATLKYNTIYRLSFSARSSNPEGRTMAIYAAGGTGLYPGLSQNVDIHSWWEEKEVVFVVPVDNRSVAGILYFFFGEKDGELSIDNIQLREVQPIGIAPGEDLAQKNIQRNPFGQNAGLSSQRFIDQATFYQELDHDYLTDLYRYVRDTIGAKQMINGAEHIYASTVLDVAAQDGATDLTLSAQGWDYISNENNTWHVRNTSPLRAGYAGALWQYFRFAQENRPMITTLAAPFPNRYQAESMLHTPAYLLLQDWDGFIWEYWDDDLYDNRTDYIDSADFSSMRNNPVLSSLMPAVSQMIRYHLLKPARTTIRLRHTADQIHLLSRHLNSWSYYALPGGINGYAPAISRIVIDSLNGQEFTQGNDFALNEQADGEVSSDTREIRWETARSTLSLNSPFVQGATGILSRAGGLKLDNMTIEAFTLNETATVLWVGLDSAQQLSGQGRSLLTVITRSEPNGFRWADSTTGSRWGNGPMLLEPARIQFTLKPAAGIDQVIVRPLDATGRPIGDSLAVTKSGADYRFSIDQQSVQSVWYSVEFVKSGSGVEDDRRGETGEASLSFRSVPNPARDETALFIYSDRDQQNVRAELCDLLGRVVRSVDLGDLPAGDIRRDLRLEDLPAGSYLLRLQSEENQVSCEIRVVR